MKCLRVFASGRALFLLSALSLAVPAQAQDLLVERGGWLLPCETARIDVGDPRLRWLLLDGFYPGERGPGRGRFAWTRRSASVAVLLTEEGPRALRLRLRGAFAGQEVQVRWDGRSLGRKVLDEGGWHEVEWPVSGRAAGPGAHVVEVRVDETRRIPPDPRDLGVLIDRLELVPDACGAGKTVMAPTASGPLVLEPGSVLATVAQLPPDAELRLGASGAGGRLTVSAVLGGRPVPPREVTVPGDPGARASVRLEPCCEPGSIVALWPSGGDRVRLEAAEIVGKEGAAAWRRACGLVPLELILLTAAVLLVGGLAWLLPQEREGSRVWLDLLVVVVAAAAVRAVFLAVYPEPAEGQDAWEYLMRARLLAEGESSFLLDTRWHAWQTWLRPPGYYLFLAGVHRLPGGWQPALVWAQAGLSVVTAAATYLVALPLFGRRAAVAAGLVFALYPEVVLTVSRVLTEPLYMAFVVSALAALARASARPSLGWAVAAGVLFGLGAHVRSAPLFFVPLAAALLLPAHGWRRGLGTGAALVAATVVTVAPWSIRNSIVSGQPMGLDDLTVINLLQVSPDEEILSTEGADLDTHEGFRQYYARLTRANRGGTLTRRSPEILFRALARMARQPGATLERFGENLQGYFSLHREGFFARPLGEARRCRTRWMTDLTNGAYLLVLLLALAAFVPAMRHRAAWPVLAWFFFNGIVINLMFHPEPKYRLPTLPVVMVLAGLTVALLVERIAVRSDPRSPGAA